MIATSATYASPKVSQPAPSRAVAPTPAAPVSNERPPQPAPPLSAAGVAFAPAAMSALIQAQEYMSSGANVLVLRHMAHEIDHLITLLGDGEPPPPPTDGAPLTVRRLQVARAQLL